MFYVFRKLNLKYADSKNYQLQIEYIVIKLSKYI